MRSLVYDAPFDRNVSTSDCNCVDSSMGIPREEQSDGSMMFAGYCILREANPFRRLVEQREVKSRGVEYSGGCCASSFERAKRDTFAAGGVAKTPL